MKFTIKHGNIAAVQYVTLPDGEIVTVTNAKDGSEEILPILPEAVQDLINKQFEVVFSLPYNERESFVKNSIPFYVEV
jgi:hypothetical protein